MDRIVIVALLLLASGSAASAGTRSHGDERRPTIAVTPSRGLHNHQLVTVRVTGFGNGVKVFLFECASAVDARHQRCGAELALQPFLVTSVRGAGTARFTVRSTAATGPPSARREKRCRNLCVVVASGINNAYDVVTVTTRIRFRA